MKDEGKDGHGDTETRGHGDTETRGHGDTETQGHRDARPPERGDAGMNLHNKEASSMADIRSYKELRVYQAAMDAAMRIFELSKRFPPDERYSLTDQVRRAVLDRCVPTLERRGESAATRPILLVSSVIQKLRLKKLEFGLKLL
jgi:hypothetical protein